MTLVRRTLGVSNPGTTQLFMTQAALIHLTHAQVDCYTLTAVHSVARRRGATKKKEIIINRSKMRKKRKKRKKKKK